MRQVRRNALQLSAASVAVQRSRMLHSIPVSCSHQRVAFSSTTFRNRPVCRRSSQRTRQTNRRCARARLNVPSASTSTQLQSETERFLDQLEQETQAESQQSGSNLSVQLQELQTQVVSTTCTLHFNNSCISGLQSTVSCATPGGNPSKQY